MTVDAGGRRRVLHLAHGPRSGSSASSAARSPIGSIPTVVPRSVEKARVMKEDFQFRKAAKTIPVDRIGAVYSVGFDTQYPNGAGCGSSNRFSKYTQKWRERDRQLERMRGRETNCIVGSTEAWYDAAQARLRYSKDGREMRL